MVTPVVNNDNPNKENGSKRLGSVNEQVNVKPAMDLAPYLTIYKDRPTIFSPRIRATAVLLPVSVLMLSSKPSSKRLYEIN